MTVKLIGIISGKKVTESVNVRIKGAKRAKSNAPLSSRMKMFGEKMKAKWYIFIICSDDEYRLRHHPWLYSKTLHILISVFYAVINMYDSEATLITSHSITP